MKINLERFFSIIVTVFLLSLVIFSNPITALNLSLTTDKPSYKAGDTVELTVDVDIENGEIIPFTDADIEIYGTDSGNSGFTSTCLLSDLNEGFHPECSSQDSKFQSVMVEYLDLESEYGDRQAEFESEDYYWGYGYGLKEKVSGKVRLTINWQLPLDWSSGNYDAKATAETELDIFGIKRRFSGKTDFTANNIGGKIAYLCRNGGFSYSTRGECNYKIEPDMISWLEDQGWEVEGKGYDEWTQDDLSFYDLMVCSDELVACKVDNNPDVFDAHKNGMPFVEIGDYKYISAAYRFDYIERYASLISPGQLYITEPDPITNGYSGLEQILPSNKKMMVMNDYYLESSVVDIADTGDDNGRSSLFKVDESVDNGRYAYVGWFYNSNPEDLTEDGDEILRRTISWSQCGKVYGCGVSTSQPDTTPPIPLNGQPTGVLDYPTVELSVETDEDAVCKGTIDADEDYEDMDFTFVGSGIYHHYISTEILEDGIHTAYVRCEDKSGNIATTSYIWSFEIDLGTPKRIAYLCRDNSCDYKIEDELISWLEGEGWEVDGKAYNTWEESELNNYGLIICSDELKACKADPDSIAYKQHMENRKPFLEVGDYNYLSAAYRFDYVDRYMGYFRKGQLYITEPDPIVDGLIGDVEILTGNPKLTLTPDYYLDSSVVDIADAGKDNGRSTTFRVDMSGDQGRYAYLGWFYNSNPDDLTPDGEMILSRTVNWAICNNVNGC